ncbi:recombination protein NinB [Pantoea stewartii]|uniref:NinB family protein n=1 Tax=Pantoea stewartii subsp. stewartii DC283 TaxID=660596 RepID=H3RDS1_PANSE|nr:recombination protein NinB [Pantoea stewartii]ARF50016.1 protein ninB [Pantoea stewartii subsp. stewartii DC283]EHU00510.1 NinB family protein [Pantoea stewartii subsp. stewartii DC283]
METQRYLLRNSSIRKNCISAIQQLPANPDKPIEIVIQERKRSSDQNRRMWPLLHDLSAQVTWFGQKYTPDDWKDLITALVAKSKNEQQRTAPGIGGGVVMFGSRTSKMRVSEMVEVIEAIYWFGTEQNVKFSDEARLEIEWAQRWGEKKRSAA